MEPTSNPCFVRIAQLNFKPTSPKFNIAPEKWWLEAYFPFGISSLAMLNFQGVILCTSWISTDSWPVLSKRRQLELQRSICQAHIAEGGDAATFVPGTTLSSILPNWTEQQRKDSCQSNAHRMSILPILPILQFQKHFTPQHSCQCALIASHLHTFTWPNKKSSHIGWRSPWHWQRLHCSKQRGNLVDKAGQAVPHLLQRAPEHCTCIRGGWIGHRKASSGLGEVVLDINPTCGAQDKLLGCRNELKTRYFLQGLEISKNSAGHSVFELQQTSVPTEDKAPFRSLLLGLKGSRAGRIPNSWAQHQPWRFDKKKISDWHRWGVHSWRKRRVVDPNESIKSLQRHS